MTGSSAAGVLAVEHLVQAALRRERTAERQLYERHHQPVRRFARRWVGDGEDASDVVQETFARAFRLLPTLGQPAEFVPWLYGIARNVCLECLKARRRARAMLPEAAQLLAGETGASPEHELMGRQAALVVSRTVEDFSEHRREALRLRVQRGLDYREIASSLGCSLAKAKVEVHRARRLVEVALRGMTLLCLALVMVGMLVGATPADPPDERPNVSSYSEAPAPALVPGPDASVSLTPAPACVSECEAPRPAAAPSRPEDIPWSDAPVTKAIEAP